MYEPYLPVLFFSKKFFYFKILINYVIIDVPIVFISADSFFTIKQLLTKLFTSLNNFS